MRILFAGPSLHGFVSPGERVTGTDIICRAPAQQGDIARAVFDGAKVIGLVDGRYEDVAAPWHKEILFALSRGLRVYGAASMGALRAAECAAYGMIPIGVIARRYLDGDLVDDAAVAQIHAPPELGCAPLSEALVNIQATIAAAQETGSIKRAEAKALQASAVKLFFKERTYAAVLEEASVDPQRRNAVWSALIAAKRDVKREDALALIAAMQGDEGSPARKPGWTFREPTAWRTFISTIEGDRRRPNATRTSAAASPSWEAVRC